MLKLKIISLIIFAGCLSCDLVNLTQISYTLYPANRDAVIGNADPVWIEFSLPVEKQTAEMLFKVQTASDSRNGDLSWQGKRLIFTPQPGWDPGVRYLLSFIGEVKTDDGRKFNISASVPFFSVTNNLPAQLVSSNPVSGGLIGSNNALTFNFSKQMDTAISISDIFILSTGTQFTHEWQNDGTTLVIRPQGSWTPLELYSWTIKTKLKDTQGIELFKEYTGTFLVQNPAAPAPVIASLVPAFNSWESLFEQIPGSVPLTQETGANPQINWIGYKDAIRINFQYATPAPPGPDDPARIDFSSLQKEGVFSIDPPVKGTLHCVKNADGSDACFVYVLDSTERFLKDTNYHIKITRDLKIMEGVPLQADFEGWFTATINDVSVTSIEISNDGNSSYATINSDQFNSYQEHIIEVDDAEHPDYYIIVFTDNFLLNDIDRYTAADKVVLSKIFPVSGVRYDKRNVTYETTTPHRLTIAFETVPNDVGTIFRLFIKGGPDGIVDSNGAYLDNDVFIYFKVKRPN
jgi:hypothetical protein